MAEAAPDAPPSGHAPGPALPADFLSGAAAATEVKREQIDFAQTELPENAGLYAVVLDGVLTAEECDALVQAAEATTGAGWEPALVNVGGGMQQMYKDTRSSERIMWDSPDVVDRLWRRIAPSVPELHELHSGSPPWNGKTKLDYRHRFTRLNERMRFLKYGSGDFFRPHRDGSYVTPDRSERSFFTLHLYLNDSAVENETSDLRGGATTFHSWNMQRRLDVHPKTGRVLIFQHMELLHSGNDVLAGTKLTMRTDLMYRRI